MTLFPTKNLAARRYDLVSCASVAEAKALLLGAPTLRAIIVRVDLPGTNNPAALAAETHGELLLSNDVSNYAATVRHEVPTPVTTGSESTTATATETICGVEVGGLALLRWCKLQPALAEVPFAVMLPPPVDPLTNPLIDGVLISFDAPLGNVPEPLASCAFVHSVCCDICCVRRCRPRNCRS